MPDKNTTENEVNTHKRKDLKWSMRLTRQMTAILLSFLLGLGEASHVSLLGSRIWMESSAPRRVEKSIRGVEAPSLLQATVLFTASWPLWTSVIPRFPAYRPVLADHTFLLGSKDILLWGSAFFPNWVKMKYKFPNTGPIQRKGLL